MFEKENRIIDLERQIAMLPQGYIVKKKINDKIYYYHRIKQDKKRKDIYIQFEDVNNLTQLINQRKELEAELTLLKKELVQKNISSSTNFNADIRIHKHLESFVSSIKYLKKRECYSKIEEYIYSDMNDKVFILYGLRRTGKTTLIRQLIANMGKVMLDKTAFIQVNSSNTLQDINSDLRKLENLGFKYVFIDEVTLMEDFIEGASLFSDIFASSGMKIVLSGTDSLGFLFTQSHQLYDRTITVHTTFIPYREFENVLGITGIDEYIRYGGTMSLSGVNYNQSIFSKYDDTQAYIDTAIAQNIQHSLEFYQDGGHFRSLYDLYKQNELTNVINRVVEDMNHRFTTRVLTRTFKSNDLHISARNLLNDRINSIDLLNSIDEEFVTSTLQKVLNILNIEEQNETLTENHITQIQEYLTLLDLIDHIDIVSLPNLKDRHQSTIITQPGMRYCQVKELIDSLFLDEQFNNLSIKDKTIIKKRILSEVSGRMLEDIVLLETKYANPHKQVFKLQFPIGEFDMVVFDPETLTCRIYEIKYSGQIIDNQYQHLISEEKCNQTEHFFGTIESKTVFYRGNTTLINDIQYLNVEEYLKGL